MLGRLFHSAAGPGRNSFSIESATEELHTRGLLFPDAVPSSSPPLSFPTGGFRPGTFDDHDGLELDERDIRLLIAQDAYADQERPSVLFDTSTPKAQEDVADGRSNLKTSLATRHERNSTSIVPSKSHFTQQSDSSSFAPFKSPSGVFHMRNRSSTVSEISMAQPSPTLRDAELRDATNDLLDCMFGSSSSTKSGTRMHIVKSGSRFPVTSSSPLESPTAWNNKTRSKPPLLRAQTSGMPLQDSVRAGRDLVLITRIFTVAPPESAKEPTDSRPEFLNEQSESFIERLSINPQLQSKRPKLREKKTLAYGVALLICLPPRPPSRPASRHGVRSEEIYHSPPASSSYGSDMQSSWTFLDALPPSLTSSQSLHTTVVDNQINYVLRRWDAIVRHLSATEREARKKISALLGQVDEFSNGPKTPKEKRMQRINQKIMRLPSFCLMDDHDLRTLSIRATRFIRSALSIPPVRPLHGGHWLEEARIVARLCSDRSNKKFLAIVLTAFLGNHYEWINEIGHEWHKKRILLQQRPYQDRPFIRSRTVIVCEDRSVARRLVFLLASFLFPGMHSLRSAAGADGQAAAMRQQQSTASRTRRDRMNAEGSTSFSSMEDGRIGHSIPAQTRRRLQRNLSETSSLRTTANPSMSIQDADFHKSSAGTTTTVTPNPSTPLAYIASNAKGPDSYFPVGVGSGSAGSAATASLQRLRRSSSTASSGPSTWGSLLGSFWSNKQDSSAASSNVTVPSEILNSSGASHALLQGKTSVTNKLENMTREVGTGGPFDDDLLDGEAPETDSLMTSPMKSDQKINRPPQLEVDENAGVVDVDLNFSRIVDSHGSSPVVVPAFTTPLSTSAASIDGAGSFFSMRSSLRTSPDHMNNIAGYLQQYHPDFVLQAIKSFSESDIKESMTSESALSSGNTDFSSNLCSTLIADVRTCSVKRITMQRRLKGSKGTQEESSNTGSDEFSVENVLEYDETLADAIERALDRSGAKTSRVPSPSPSRSIHGRTVSSSANSTSNATPPHISLLSSTLRKDSLPQMPAPQRNRGQLIIDALKEVVIEVDRDLHGSQNHQDSPSCSQEGNTVSREQGKEENALREGVKRWLQDAEETFVW